MGKIEELKKLVSDMFKDATDQKSIESLATINNSISEVEKEHNELVDKNAKLIISYKDLVKHTSFKDDGGGEGSDQGHGATKSFDDVLKNYIAKTKKGD